MTTADNLEQAEKDGKVSYTTYGNIEQVLYAKSETFSIANSVGTTTLTFQPPFTSITYPLGIFSFDGGTTYYDFYPYVTTAVTGVAPTVPSVQVKPHVISGGEVQLEFKVNATVGGGSTIPVIVNLVLVKSEYFGLPTVENPPESGKVLYSSPLPTATGREAVSIAKPDEFSSDMTDGLLKTYTHDQGRIPNVVAWVYGNNGAGMFPLNIHDTRGSTGFGNSIKTDTTNVYLGCTSPGSIGLALYKVYKEQ